MTPPPSAHLRIVSGMPSSVFVLPAGDTVVGRSPGSDWILEHVEVSRRHCRFDSAQGQWRVEDLESRAGTHVNGVRITEPTVLKPGDSVAIGPVLVLFALGEPARIPTPGAVEVPVLHHGRPVAEITLHNHLTFGRDAESDVMLNDPGVSRKHAVIRREAEGGFRVIDLGGSGGSFINGHRFDEHELIAGDQLQVGPFVFQFDGCRLQVVTGSPGAIVRAAGLRRQVRDVQLLGDVSLEIAPCHFAGILGPSGAGKSSLLSALSGMAEPDSGQVLIDGVNPYEQAGVALGFVPQEDIVHRELTVQEALRFGAELRLPAGIPAGEIDKLVLRTMHQLGLADRAGTRIGQLSGGQRKRVSVGVELLARPRVLFLDEPSSGLDPATEFKLMELLRKLADSGCTIVCTTHVMENVYLMDQLLVMHRGRLLFSGAPKQVREHFGVQRLSALYDRLESDKLPEEVSERESKPSIEPTRNALPRRAGRPFSTVLRVLLARQWAILRADWKNFALLLGQPLVVAALVSWVTDDHALALFFAYIGTLWFGASNAAQEIVRELPVYRRERAVGVGRAAYLASKLIFLCGLTLAQAVLLYVVLQLGEHGLDGSVLWQSLGLASIAMAAVGIGCAVSALARSLLQSVLVIPLILIPLILFSGFTVPAHEMRPGVAAVSALTPAYSAQRLMDTSFLWGKPIERATLAGHWSAFRNLNRAGNLKTGEVFLRGQPGLVALIVNILWALVGAGAALVGLRLRER